MPAIGSDCQVDVTLRHGVDKRIDRGVKDSQYDLGAFLCKPANRCGQEHACQHKRCRNTHHTGRAISEIGGSRIGPTNMFQDSEGCRQVILPRTRQLYMSRAAIEQPKSNRRFELCNELTNGRRRQAKV